MRKLWACLQLIAVIAMLVICLPGLSAEDTAKININTASEEELMQLKGIGQKKAEVIVEFRENNGPFQLLEDLLKVPGIGPKTFEANKDHITLE